MMKTARKIFALFCAVSLLMTGCASDKIIKEKIMDSLDNGIVIDSISENRYKTEESANPLSPNILLAPTRLRSSITADFMSSAPTISSRLTSAAKTTTLKSSRLLCSRATIW